MDDLVERLRRYADEPCGLNASGEWHSLINDAAAEIERLRAEREVIGAEAVKCAGKSGRLDADAARAAAWTAAWNVARDAAWDAALEAEAKVDRLAEAGRRVIAAFRAHGEASPFTRQADRTRHECEAAMLSLADALREYEQENQRE